MIKGQWLTLRQLQQFHREAHDEGVLCAIQMLRLTAEQYDAALMPHPTLNQVADQIAAILAQRQSERPHD